MCVLYIYAYIYYVSIYVCKFVKVKNFIFHTDNGDNGDKYLENPQGPRNCQIDIQTVPIKFSVTIIFHSDKIFQPKSLSQDGIFLSSLYF